MKRQILTLFIMTFPLEATQVEMSEDVLPYKSGARICTILPSSMNPQVMVEGDVGIIRVDMSHLLTDPKIPDYDIERLRMPYNLLTPQIAIPNHLEVLAQKSKLWGQPGEQRIEYIYFVKAKSTGETEFSTQRRHSVVVGMKEMGDAELAVLKMMTDFKKLLLEKREQTPAFEFYMRGQFPGASLLAIRIFGEMSDGEQNQPLPKRIELAQKRIDDWRASLSPKEYADYKIKGNILPFKIIPAAMRSDANGAVHELRFNQFPKELEVKHGDLITVESIRPSEIVGDNYAHKYDPPDVEAIGLFPIYSQTLERARLGNDHGSNRIKHYFIADTIGDSLIRIGKPKISHPYTPNQPDVWAQSIKVKVTR